MKPPDSKVSKLGTKASKLDDLLDGSDMRLPMNGKGRSSRGRSNSHHDDIELDDLVEVNLPLAADGSVDANPNPVELPSPINPEGGRKQSVETHRNLFCLHYDNCLDEAVKRGWNSFTCVRCGLYRVEKDEEVDGVERYATQRRL